MIKSDIYKESARALNELLADFAATGGSNNSVLAADLPFTRIDQVAGAELFMVSGGGAGQVRVVASYNPTTKALHVVPTLSTIPSSNTQGLLFERFRTTDFRGAVDRAMGIARLRYLDPYMVNITLAATQYEYNVPSGVDFIAHLQLVPTAGTDYDDTAELQLKFVFEYPQFRVENNKIIFDPRHVDMTRYDNERLRIVGQSRPSALGTDNATVPSMLEEYLITKSCEILAARRTAQSKEWAALFAFYKAEATSLEGYISTAVRGEEVR